MVGLDEFEGGDDDEDDGGDIVLDEEYSSMVQELQEMDDIVFTLDKADDNALNWLTAWSAMILQGKTTI